MDPWVEKYRPRRLEEVVGNEDILIRLRAISVAGNMPHLLLCGPPGVGKTTSIACLAGALLGYDAKLMKEAVLELNASDERGIDVVRGQIKSFATKKVVFPPQTVGKHKIIILDEADSMTPGAQQALRRIMEIYASTTRFALACNTSAKIIEPIQSRCAILRYTRVPPELVLERLVRVAQAEGVGYSPEGMEALCFTADGDIRTAINNLQATCAVCSSPPLSSLDSSRMNVDKRPSADSDSTDVEMVDSSIGHGVSDFPCQKAFITPEAVYRVCDVPSPVKVEQVVQACIRRDLQSAQSIMDDLCSMGYATVDLVVTFFRVVKTMPRDRLCEPLQLQFIRHIGLVHVRILEGVTGPLQLSAMLGSMCLCHA